MTVSIHPASGPATSPGLQGPGRIILHADMDSFYASAEVRRRPELRGRPVVVGADPKAGTGRGVACTCSYEARAFGIRSAMPVSQAYTLCPHAVFLPPDFPYYAQVSREIMDLLRSYGFPFLQVSIDEAYLDLTSCGSFDTATDLARTIQKTITRHAGLSCSIGIAQGKILAKIASDFQKPGGMTVIMPGSAQVFLSPLPVKKIPGIGSRAGSELLEMGIRTIGDLAASDVQRLIGRFGRGAARFHVLARGIDDEGLESPDGIRSISRETTFETDTGDFRHLVCHLDRLTAAVHRNLSGESLRCRTVTVKVRYQGYITRTKTRTLPCPTSDIGPILSCTRALFLETFDGRPVRLIGVRLSSLEKTDRSQTTLMV